MILLLDAVIPSSFSTSLRYYNIIVVIITIIVIVVAPTTPSGKGVACTRRVILLFAHADLSRRRHAYVYYIIRVEDSRRYDVYTIDRTYISVLLYIWSADAGIRYIIVWLSRETTHAIRIPTRLKVESEVWLVAIVGGEDLERSSTTTSHPLQYLYYTSIYPSLYTKFCIRAVMTGLGLSPVANGPSDLVRSQRHFQYKEQCVWTVGILLL